MSLSFFVHGDPKAQPRPRAFAFHGKARVYDSGTAEGWKALVAVELQRHWDRVRLEGPVDLTIRLRVRRPKGHFRASGALKPAAPIWCERKPDADNYAKAIMDCLTQCGLWGDDAQVCRLCVTKVWADAGGEGAGITINQLADGNPVHHVAD